MHSMAITISKLNNLSIVEETSCEEAQPPFCNLGVCRGFGEMCLEVPGGDRCQCVKLDTRNYFDQLSHACMFACMHGCGIYV